MSTKEQLRAESRDGTVGFVRKDAHAERPGVGRDAERQAVQALRDKGFAVGAVADSGRSPGSADAPTEAELRRFLPGGGPKWDIRVYPSISSTNTVLKEMAENGAPEGTILVACEQTAGRGRMGRTFYSPAGAGVYLSLLLRPAFSPSKSLYITTAAAVAVAEAIETVAGRETKIKWVNDVYIDGRKVCGILTEASFDAESGRLAYAVAGVGINMRPPGEGCPEELRPLMTSVFENGGYDGEKRARIVAEFISRFWNFYGRLAEKPFLRGYRRRSLLDGEAVDVIRGGARVPAIALGIDDECRLRVRYGDGREEYLQSGEVSVKPRGNG